MALLTTDCARSNKLPKLSPEALSLFFLIIPQLNNHGKMQGSPAYVKEVAAPKISWLSISKVAECLSQITIYTNIKWFEASDNLLYLHSLNHREHNKQLRRLGADRLPNYNGEPVPTLSSFAAGMPPAAAEGAAPAGATPPPVAAPAEQPAKKKEAKETAIPEGFCLDAKTTAHAERHGLDDLEIKYQLEQFTYYHTENPKGGKLKHKNWQRAFENWVTSQYFKPMPAHVREVREEEAYKLSSEKFKEELAQADAEHEKRYAEDPEYRAECDERDRKRFGGLSRMGKVEI